MKIKFYFSQKATAELVNLKPRKVGWSDQGRKDLREDGGNCLKYLKRGWNRKERRGHKDFKGVGEGGGVEGGEAGSRGECLKKGEGAWIPL